MSSIIRARSGLIFSCVMGTSDLAIEKVPIVRPESPPGEAPRSDQCHTPGLGALPRERLNP